MATTVAQHAVATFSSPVNGSTPIDANTVRGNDNTIRTSYNDHDADTGVHVQSSTLASRPAAGTAGRKWITSGDGDDYHLWFDDGTNWIEVGGATHSVLVRADAALAAGKVVKLTGYNATDKVPTVNVVAATSDTAFGVVEVAISSGATGYVIITGVIRNVINTSSFSALNQLYQNGSAAFTATKPTSGEYQPCAVVLSSHATTGVVYVEFQEPRIVERSDNTANTIVLRDGSGAFTTGAITSAGLITFASLKGTGATTVTTILDEDNMATDSATALATQQSIKAYVDTKVTAEDLDFAGGSGTGSVDLDSQTFTIAGTSNEITTVAGSQTLTISLPDDVTIGNDLTVTRHLDVDGTANLDAVDIDGAVQVDAAVTVGVDDTGYDVKFFGDTASAYMLWDTSADDLILAGAAGLDVDGDTSLDNTDVDGTLVVDGSNISLDSTSTLNIDNSNTSNGITIGTATSGVPVSIGHTTSEVTVNDNLTVTGTLTLGSGAELTEAELEMLDGITAGTVAASKAVVVDSNKDIASFRNVTLTGELDAATLDVSGAIDVAGTANLDVVDIDGAVDMASTLQVDGAITGSSTIQGTTITATTALAGTLSTAAQTNITSVGALNGGSITSGFGAIDVGSSAISGGAGTLSSLSVGDGNITNVGDIALDSISSDGSAIGIGASGDTVTCEGAWIFNEASADVDLRVEGNGEANLLFVDAGNDHVGIGTNTPSARLHVKDGQDISMDASASGQVHIQGNGYSGAIALDSGYMNIYHNAASIGIAFGTNETGRMYIDSGGIVTIGRTSGHAFTVSGHQFYQTGEYYNATPAGEVVRWYDANSGNDVGSIDTTSSNTAYNTSSDRRLKENIETADSSGSLIDDIEIVKHDWISSDDKVRYGVIAQDLFEVVPEAVSRGTDGDFVEEDLSGDEMPTKQVWGVDYSKLVPLLVKEVQELRARVAELEA